MSLPSQSARTSTRSSTSNYRKSRSRANPFGKMLPAVLVVGAIGLVLWYALKRPSDETPTELAGSSPAQIDPGPDLSPSRTLPGSGDRPDPEAETQRLINQPTDRSNSNQNRRSTTTSSPVTISNSGSETRRDSGSTTQTNRQSGGQTLSIPRSSESNSSLLSATRNQTNRPTTNSTTQNSTSSAVPPRATGSDRVRLQLDTAQRMVKQNDPVGARRLLSQTLNTPSLSERDAHELRHQIGVINDSLIFGPNVHPDDPICEDYTIQSGDSLSRIAARRELTTHWKLIQRVNGISNPSRIRLGQKLKLVRGPFHAIVYKDEHRMDVYHGAPNDRSGWTFIKSFNVGLGENDGTPVGEFTISPNKLENPGWVNPRDSSERYAPNDPDNPIGEYWLGLDGIGKYSSLTGFGLHGTTDPDSIGDNRSMGCVRLSDDDIALIYELLGERVSRVDIRP